jgi:hypothetical protein
MNETENWYIGVVDEDKVIFLALVMAQLTIHGRSFGLDLIAEQQTRAFVGLNELQHLISNHCAAIGMNRDRYPDVAFLEVIKEKAMHYGLAAHLAQSFDFARSREYWKTLG